VDEHRELTFGTQFDHSNFQLADNKLSLKGVWLHHMTHFNFLGPHSYLRNGWS